MTAEQARTQSLLDARWLPAAGHLVLLALVVLLVRSSVPTGLLVGWGTTIVALVLTRAAWSWYARRRRLSLAVVAPLIRLFVTGLGLAWGVGAAAAMRYVPLTETAIGEMGLAGLLAGAINTLLADRWAFPMYAVALFGPTFVTRLTGGPTGVNGIEVALIGIFVVFMTLQHRRAHHTLLERLRVEEELRDRERQLAAAQAIAHVGSWEWDMATNAVTWSDELRRMYGVAPDAPAGYAEFLARAHPDDRARLEALVADGVRTHRTIDYEWRAVRPDGEERVIQGRNVVITDQSGQAVRMAGTSFDITERKRAETELRVLRGILPICSSCKRIRAEDGTWEAVESYVRDHTNAEFSHGICPDCAARDWGATTGPKPSP